MISTGSFVKNTKLVIRGRGNKIIIGPRNRLYDCKITILGNNCEVVISDNCILRNLELHIEDNLGRIIIGRRTTIEGAHIASTEGEGISIGDDCMFSSSIEIRSGDSHAIYDLQSGSILNFAKSIDIGSHVWVCAGVRILKGAKLENGLIVGAGAIVTGHHYSNTIIAGVPARMVKTNIRWNRNRVVDAPNY